MARCRTCGEAFLDYPPDIESIDCPTPTFCETAREQDAERPPVPAPIVTFANTEEWDTAPMNQEWTVDQRIPRREVCLFSGEGGAGKSTIGLHLCAAHVLGKDWCGSLPEMGSTMFVDAEDDLQVIRRRFWWILQHYGATAAELQALRIVSLHGKDAVMATVSRGLVVPTKLYDELIVAARMFEPQTIVLASVANFFAGSEIDRSHVTQFLGMMSRLAVEANGSVILISHPSLEGKKNDSGISGSTQWHNAVRSRMYLTTTGENGAELKKLEFRKNQYGPIAASVTLQWQNGLFLPVGGPGQFERAASEARTSEMFGALLASMNRMESWVSAEVKARNYAPRVFAATDEAKAAGIKTGAFESVLRRLFDEGKLQNVRYGKPSKPNVRIDFTDGSTE